MKLCCFFNYAPLYRESIYKAIDDNFDSQFYFGKEVYEGKNSGIAKLDYSIFKKEPIEFRNKVILKHFLWRTKAWRLAFKQFDTFLITGDFVFSYIPLILGCKLLGKKIYGWGHGIKAKGGKLHFLNDFLYRNLSGFFTYGEGGKKRLEELGYDSTKIHVIYNSLTKRIKPMDYESDIYIKHFKNSNPTLLFIGRLTPQKKLDWVIKAVSALGSCNLMVIGDGACKTELEQLTISLGVQDKVWFFGENYDNELNKEFIYNADICISPGNVGLTALHALEFGTPVISHSDFESQMPEYEVIKQYKTGLLYENNNFEDFCKKIHEWLEFSADKRESIRHNCYTVINDKWNSDYQIELLKRVFHD